MILTVFLKEALVNNETTFNNTNTYSNTYSIIGRKDEIVAMILFTLDKPCALANLAYCGWISLFVVSDSSPFLFSCFDYLCIHVKRAVVGSLSICLNLLWSEK